MAHKFFNIDVADITTFGIHAKASCAAYYDNLDELTALLADDCLPRPFKHVGSGSNLLFTADFPGTLLMSRIGTTIITGREDGSNIVDVTASAGVEMDALCHDMARRGIWGLENLSGIPGTVGASAVQNVGAYGVEAGDLIESVEAIEIATRKPCRFTHDEIQFGYRHSIFKTQLMRDRFIITRVHFRLTLTPSPRLGYANLQSVVGANPSAMQVRDAVIAIRDSKLPDPEKPAAQAGFFKNPVITPDHFRSIEAMYPGEKVPHFILGENEVKVPAAWLIDRAGCKTMTEGGASLWPTQPLVIVNTDGTATSADILTLENRIITAVATRFAITLTPEVEHI